MENNPIIRPYASSPQNDQSSSPLIQILSNLYPSGYGEDGNIDNGDEDDVGGYAFDDASTSPPLLLLNPSTLGPFSDTLGQYAGLSLTSAPEAPVFDPVAHVRAMTLTASPAPQEPSKAVGSPTDHWAPSSSLMGILYGTPGLMDRTKGIPSLLLQPQGLTDGYSGLGALMGRQAS